MVPGVGFKRWFIERCVAEVVKTRCDGLKLASPSTSVAEELAKPTVSNAVLSHVGA